MNVTLAAGIVPPSMSSKRLGYAYFRAQFDIGLTDIASHDVGIEQNKVGAVTGLPKSISFSYTPTVFAGATTLRWQFLVTARRLGASIASCDELPVPIHPFVQPLCAPEAFRPHHTLWLEQLG
jgi:hypothetical protein